jgi:Leucine-rich repeat (LRR) protein
MAKVIRYTCLTGEVHLCDLSVEEINCAYNQLTTLTISNCPNLRYLNCAHNQLSKLTISNCPNLQVLTCAYNHLCKIVDNLYEVNCTANNISKITNMQQIVLRPLDYTLLPQHISSDFTHHALQYTMAGITLIQVYNYVYTFYPQESKEIINKFNFAHHSLLTLTEELLNLL